jgi:hypothetical protein
MILSINLSIYSRHVMSSCHVVHMTAFRHMYYHVAVDHNCDAPTHQSIHPSHQMVLVSYDH